MKKRLEPKYLSSILSTFGLVLLILLSPCKVKNYIQAELGIPQTKVINKSQSTISQSNCLTFDAYITLEKGTNPTVQQSDLLHSASNRLVARLVTHLEPCFLYSTRNLSAPAVPLYILYQNLKIYS